jgi:O-antigen ligase
MLLGGILAAAVLGAFSAVSPVALLVVPAFLFVAFILTARPLHAFLLIYGLRTLSDSALLPPLVSTAVNVLLLGSALLVLVVRKFREPGAPGATALVLLVMVTIGSAIGMLNYGPAPSILGELLRAFGVIAIALLATRVSRETPALTFARGLLAASIPALAAVVAGGALKLPYFYSVETGRAFGTFSHPLGAAGFMTLVALLSLFVLRQRRSALPRWTLSLAMVGTLFTISLSGLMATATALAVYIWVYRFRVHITWMHGVGVLAAVAFLLTPTGQLFLTRLATVRAPTLAQATSATNADSLEWRLRNWYQLLIEWQRAPLFGHGWGTTYELIRPLGKTPHSGPVRLLVEVGVVGLIVAGWLAWRAASGAARQLSEGLPGTPAREAAGLRLAALAAVVANSLAANTMGYIPMLLLFVAMWSLSDAPALDRNRSTEARRTAALVT